MEYENRPAAYTAAHNTVRKK